MVMWFAKFVEVEDPGLKELVFFLDEIEILLSAVLREDALLDKLWHKDSNLRIAAQESFEADVKPGLERMREQLMQLSLRDAPDQPRVVARLKDHGLIGVSARFKFLALVRISRGWRKYRGQMTVRTGFRRVFEGIDAILDSLVSALGVGGAVKEFKDMIMALALK